MSGHITSGSSLFNSPLETGTRALVILDAAHPASYDLTQLTWFDHLIVYTGDLGGPPSLHPAVPHRTGELLVRRRLIESGLALMRRVHLIEQIADSNGLEYRATDEASAFVELMCSPYSKDLRARAVWLVENICVMPIEKLRELISNRIGRWGIEFLGNDAPEVHA